jgi:hypothetical protein
MSNVQDHIDDIDFRSWDARNAQALQDFVKWYKILTKERSEGISERLEGQITMLSSVLWYMLPPAEYKRLVGHKTGYTPENINDFSRYDDQQRLV